jgi:GNAT superfamily N-acetyltransferase
VKGSYTQLLSPIKLAVLDADPAGENAWRIARVNVPQGYRGQGVGSQLMNEICADADAAGVTLTLEPIPYDGPERLDDLVRFYERFGFTLSAEGMTRLPQTVGIA